MKHALVATLLLLGSVAVGCGSAESDDAAPAASSSPSSSASTPAVVAGDVDSLCAILTSTTEISTGPQIAALARSLSGVGAIADMTASQAKGLDLYVGALEAVDPEATADEVAAITDLGLTSAQETKVEDFFTYASSACTPSASADPSESAGG